MGDCAGEAASRRPLEGDSWRTHVAASEWAEPLAGLLADLVSGRAPRAGTPVKRTRARAIHRIETSAGPLYAKWYAAPKRSFAPGVSRARREYRNLERLRRLGVAAVEPVAWAERYAGRGGCGSLLLTRALVGARALSAVVADRAEGAPERVAELARIARALHDAGLWHRDLHVGNALVADNGVVLVDPQRLRALPASLPRALRVRDLAALHASLERAPGSGELQRGLLSAYAAAPPVVALAPLRGQVERAAARRLRRQLASRGRRCVRPSTGFRIERGGARVVYRRADVAADDVLAAIAAHSAIVSACAGRRGLLQHALRDRVSRVDGVLGGPPAGRAVSGFGRGQGAPEPGAPARAPVRVREFRATGGLQRLAQLVRRHPGMAAWRDAHARLLRDRHVPSPLALVEERRLGLVHRAYLVSRWE